LHAVGFELVVAHRLSTDTAQSINPSADAPAVVGTSLVVFHLSLFLFFPLLAEGNKKGNKYGTIAKCLVEKEKRKKRKEKMEGTPQDVLTKDVAFDMVAMAVRKCTKLIRDMVSARKQAESCADAMYEEEEYAYVHFQKCFEHYDEVIDTAYERMRFLLRNQHVGAYRVIYEDREGDLHIHGIFRNKEDAEKYADAMHSTLGHRPQCLIAVELGPFSRNRRTYHRFPQSA
jgi:hypothetical protein